MSPGAVRAAFSGLSAFPLTPLVDDTVDQAAFTRIVTRLAAAGVDSITALGSTGCAAYLSRDERARVAELAVAGAGSVPVLVGVSALRTSDAMRHARDVEAAGAAGLLLAPMSYQRLTGDDVFGLYADLAAASELPIVVYDNPGTTHFEFDLELYARIAEIPSVASIKIPGVPAEAGAARERVAEIRAAVPDRVTVGVSGDAFAARGLAAGCDAWYSVIGGTLPELALGISDPARSGDPAAALARSAELAPLWELFAQHGSLRVTAAIAESLGLAQLGSLPLPIRGLDEPARADVDRVLSGILGPAPRS
ncbi:dihydrodipicolinate synthase family protein [Leucobacter luti]|uniref:dihydrodipicolinate synthase family protein n=1 Tax=Leucobacter luti TaxID=340320 RepID=UPI003D022DDF